MDRVEAAVSCFKEGFSCSQAVFSSFSGLFGLDRNQSLKIAQAFGGGMAHLGEACGAVTGALLVIGLKYGRAEAADEAAKEKTYAVSGEFVKRFKSLHGSIKCPELIGCDIGTEEGMKQARENNLFDNICSKLVRDAAEILERIL